MKKMFLLVLGFCTVSSITQADTTTIAYAPPSKRSPTSSGLKIASLVAAPISVLATYLLCFCGNVDNAVERSYLIAPLLATPYALALAARITDTTDELSLERYKPESPLKNILNIIGMQMVTGIFCGIDKASRTARNIR